MDRKLVRKTAVIFEDQIGKAADLGFGSYRFSRYIRLALDQKIRRDKINLKIKGETEQSNGNFNGRGKGEGETGRIETIIGDGAETQSEEQEARIETS